MTDDSKRTQRLPMPAVEERAPHSPRRSYALELDPSEEWPDEEVSTRNTDAAIPLPDDVPYSDWWFALCAAQAASRMASFE